MVALARSEDGPVSTAARQGLDKLPEPIVMGALQQPLQADVVAELASRFGRDPVKLPMLLHQESLTEDVLCELASRADERAGELLGTNEVLVLRFPAVIEKLYMNKNVRMSTADRLIDLAVRNNLELDFPAFKQAAQAICEQLIPEPSEARNFSDDLFCDLDRQAEETENEIEEGEPICQLDDEGNERVVEKALPLFAQIQQASVTEKIRMAMLGNSTARLLLVRDSNRLVAEAAAKSPRVTENEATQMAAMRSVTDEVLRLIGNNRELVRSYQVKLNMVTNPRTPFTFASRFIPHLRLNDLRQIARSKNVPGAVSKVAKQALLRRK